MILILSGTDVISGAEYVLKDFIDKTAFSQNFNLLSSDITEVKKFYSQFPIQKAYTTSSLNPVGAKHGSIFLKALKVFKYIKSSLTILNIAKQTNSTIVLGNNSGDIIYSLWVKLFSKKKFYLYVHDIIKSDPSLRKTFSFFDKYVDKYIVVSEATRNSLIECNINPEKIELVYNGLSVKTDVQPKEWSDGTISVGFVGALIPRKNPLLFVKIIHELVKKKLPVKGTMVFNHIEEDCKNEVTQYITKNKLPVELLGALKRSEMEEYYKKLHFLVVSSKRDPFPTVILEAFNNALPVIGIKNDGIPEMITDNCDGRLFDTEGDLEKVTDFLEHMTESTYKELSIHAQETIKNRFSIEQKVDKLETILELK